MMKVRTTVRPLDDPQTAEGEHVAVTLSTGAQFILQEVDGRLRVRDDSARSGIVVMPIDWRHVEIGTSS